MTVAKTKIRGVRVPDELWEQASAKAKRRHETVSAVIVRGLLAYVEDEKADTMADIPPA